MTTIGHSSGQHAQVAVDNPSKSWRWIRLGEICEIVMGQSPDGASYNTAGIGEPLLNGPTEFGLVHPSPVQWTTSPVRFAEPQDILFCVRGATTGRKNIADRRYCIGRGLAAIRGKERFCITEYLFHALSYVSQIIMKETSGSTFPNLPLEKLDGCEIPLPPLQDQRRIVERLTSRFDAVERARYAADARQSAAKSLPTAYLRSVFNTTDDGGWPRARLGDLLASPLRTGISKSGLPSSDKRCLTLSAVRDGVIDLTATKPASVTDSEAKGNWLKPNAFYVVRGNGNRSLVGRGGLAPESIPDPVLYPDLLIEVNPDPDKLAGGYLRLVWDSESVRQDIEGHARTSAGIYKINQENLSNITIPVPPLPEQYRIIRELGEKLASANRVLTGLARERELIDQLPAAILGQAFAGRI